MCTSMLANAQILGCMDANACNYNPLANVSDGSCQYSYNEAINMFDLDTTNYNNSDPSAFVVINDIVYFVVNNNYDVNTRLFKYDHTIDSVILLQVLPTINPFKWSFVAINDILYFQSAGNFTNLSYPLWKYDTSVDSLMLVHEIGDRIYDLTVLNDVLYFRSWGGPDTTNSSPSFVNISKDLWKYDPAIDSAMLVSDIIPESQVLDFFEITLMNDMLLIGAVDSNNIYKFWKYDPAIDSSMFIFDTSVWPFLQILNSGSIVMNDIYYFGAKDNIHGYNVWKYDPTIDSVMLVYDINPSNNYGGMDYPFFQTIYQFAIMNDILYFIANDGIHGKELWKYDPAIDSAMLVYDIYPGQNSSSDLQGDNVTSQSDGNFFTVMNDILYFPANDGIHGRELWSYNPAIDSAMMVYDIYPGLGSSVKYNDRLGLVHNDMLFFSANDSIHGMELWTYESTQNIASVNTEMISACNTFTWIDGNTYTASNNTAAFTYTNVSGCDSVIILDLTINNSNTGIDTQEHCDAYTWIDGNTYTASNNTATLTLTNASGCDSVVTLDLTIKPSPEQLIINQYWSTTFNTGESFAYQWYLNGEVLENDTTELLNFIQGGSYTVEAINSFGCKTMSEPFVIGTLDRNFDTEIDFIAFPNPTKNLVFIELMEELGADGNIIVSDLVGQILKKIELKESTSCLIDFSIFKDGPYIITVKYPNGLKLSKTIIKN